jgi:hypothetical protein
MNIKNIVLLPLFLASINAHATQQISYSGQIIFSQGSVANVSDLFSGQFTFNPDQPGSSQFAPVNPPYTEWEGGYWNSTYLSTAIQNKFSFVSDKGISFAFQDNRNITQAEIDLHGFNGHVNQGNYDIVSFEAINLGNNEQTITGTEFSITALFEPSQFNLASFQYDDLQNVFQSQPVKFGYEINKVTNGLLDFHITGLIDSFNISNPSTSVALPSAPVLPTPDNGGGSGGFDFASPPETVFDNNGNPMPGNFYDPDVAVAYTYEAANLETRFGNVMIPNQYGDGKFALLIWDEASGEYIDSGIQLLAGVWFNFADLGFQNGLGKFRIAGIETSAMIDPSDPQGFVTGLTFTSTGSAFKMTPLTAPVPLPGTLWLFASSLISLLGFKRRNSYRE